MTLDQTNGGKWPNTAPVLQVTGHVDVYLLCFSVAAPSSLRSLHTSWVAALPGPATLLLVGCQADLRLDKLR